MAANPSTSILYLSYDGLLEPLGESQVLQYLEGLADKHTILLLSFEKPADWSDKDRIGKTAQRTKASGIRWTPLRYTKSPPGISTAYDILRGLLFSVYLALRYRVRVVHARSYVPAVVALFLKSLLGVKFIFDIRGFWPDERVNAGLWPVDGMMYRVAKWFEGRFFRSADVIVSLTHAAADAIRAMPGLQGKSLDIEVIPTCVNRGLFVPSGRSQANESTESGETFVLGCVGTVGAWFRFDAVLDFFARLLDIDANARLLVLNRGQHELIRNSAREKQIPQERIDVYSVEYVEMPNRMARMSAGVFFYQPSYSELARSPTKTGEFLACGVPCVTNRGIGDSERILSESGTGVVLSDFTTAEFERGAKRIVELAGRESTRELCTGAAETYFSLDAGVDSYGRIYEKLLADRV